MRVSKRWQVNGKTKIEGGDKDGGIFVGLFDSNPKLFLKAYTTEQSERDDWCIFIGPSMPDKDGGPAIRHIRDLNDTVLELDSPEIILSEDIAAIAFDYSVASSEAGKILLAGDATYLKFDGEGRLPDRRGGCHYVDLSSGKILENIGTGPNAVINKWSLVVHEGDKIKEIFRFPKQKGGLI